MIREITFRQSQCMWMWSQSTNVKDGKADRQTDRRMDTQHTTAIPRYARMCFAR